MPQIIIAIPCYNEELRFDPAGVDELLSRANVSLILVNDGSKDGTLALLERVAAKSPTRIAVLNLPRNRGKGEAVRLGLRQALASGGTIVGYLDADFATPPAEMLRLIDEALRSSATMVIASRVRLLGRHVERDPLRHGLGRIFATAGSIALRLPIYDTQCGAKLIKDCPALHAALRLPFRSRWAFDVELIKRLLLVEPALSADDFLEVPVTVWRDKAGSKLTFSAMAKAALDLVRIGFTTAESINDADPDIRS